MAPSSDRRSGSSDGSRKRRSVYISSDQSRHAASEPSAPKAGGRVRATRRGSGQPPALGRARATAAKNKAPKAASSSAGVSGTTPGGQAPPAAGRPRRSKGATRFAAEKRDEREQRLASRRLRNRIIIGGLVILVAASVAGWIALYRSSAFSVTRVVVTGNRHLTGARVIRLAGLPPGTTLLRLPEQEMIARLDRDPWVAGARLERQFPDTLRIVVNERVPVAAVDTGAKGRWLLDVTGTMIASQTASATLGLPLVKDAPVIPAPRPGLPPASAQIANAVQVVDGLSPQLHKSLQYVSARTVDETAVFVTPGVEILMGVARQLDKKDYLARRILTDQKGKVVFIDVRSVDRPVWRGLGK